MIGDCSNIKSFNCDCSNIKPVTVESTWLILDGEQILLTSKITEDNDREILLGEVPGDGG